MPASPKTSKPRGQHLIPVLCLMCCGLLTRLPAGWEEFARSLVLDSMTPVREGKVWLVDFGEQYRSQDSQRIEGLIRQHEQERRKWELQSRRHIVMMAELLEERERRQSSESSPFAVTSNSPLIEAGVVSAEVISARQLEFLSQQLLLDVPDAEEPRADQLVLQSLSSQGDEETPEVNLVIDQGRAAGMRESLPVMAGQCVVGKLSDVGRRISRVRLVTDPLYRGRARILRTVDDGYAYGPEGILEGTGEELCRLRYVSPKLSVRVGDEVFTADPLTSSSAPLYYGRIVKAELDENAHEWSLWIRPGCRFETLNTVQILQEQIATERILAN